MATDPTRDDATDMVRNAYCHSILSIDYIKMDVTNRVPIVHQEIRKMKLRYGQNTDVWEVKPKIRLVLCTINEYESLCESGTDCSHFPPEGHHRVASLGTTL